MKDQLIQYLSNFLTDERLSVFQRVLSQRTNYLTVVLEDIYQTQNASAVIRSAECFGIQTVHVIENNNIFHVNPDVVQGASKWITLKRYNDDIFNTVTALRALKKEGYRIVATSPHECDVNLENFDLNKGKAAFVFGTERPGLTDAAKQEADEFMKIPMVGFTESLNISVSAAVTLHHLSHQLRNHSDIDWKLSEEDRQEVMLDWLRKTIRRVDLLEKKFQELKQNDHGSIC